jgi:ABC-2 type transport system permease protein
VVETYIRLTGASIRSQYQYRVSFWLQMAGQFMATVIDFVAVLVIFRHIPALGGWTIYEVAFLYGVSGIAFALSDMVVGEVERVHLMIKDGRFDSLLIRPLGTLTQIGASQFQVKRVGRIAQAGLIFVYAVAHLGVDWSATRVVMTVSMVLAGAVIFGAIFVIGSAVTFWTLETTEMTNAFTYGGNYLTSWPLNIFSSWLRRLLAFVIPLGFVNYFPSLYVLDKHDPLGLPSALRFLGPPVALVTAWAAFAIWRVAVGHYRSTGS